DAPVPAELDRSIALAAAEALRESGAYAAGSSRGNSELLPHQSVDGGCRSREWKHQKPASERPRLQEPPLPPFEGSTDGRDQDGICRFQESGMKCWPPRILAQSPQNNRPRCQFAPCDKRYLSVERR